SRSPRGTGRLPRLRAPRRRKGAARARSPHPEAGVLRRVAGVRGRPRGPSPHLGASGRGRVRHGACGQRRGRVLLSLALAFLDDDRPLDYGSRLARLRWRRAASAAKTVVWRGETPARDALSGADEWMVVAEAAALPAFRT